MALNRRNKELKNHRTLELKSRRTNVNFGKIGILMGGPSSEREISLKSGKAVYEAISRLGFNVVSIDIKTDNIQENIRLIKSSKISCAFLALHGRFGEDGQIQGILDILNIPYTGSGALASRLAMDKIAARQIFSLYGINVPRYKTIDKCSYSGINWRMNNRLSFPVVVKPSTHGSSIGLSIVDKVENFDKAIELAFSFDEKVLIEEYVSGREVTVGVLDEKALPVVEIVPKNRFFDYEAKYKTGMTDYIVPAQLESEIVAKVQETALLAHKLLGCSGCSRVDVILDSNNTPFVLEVNTIPGFTETSLLPKAAKAQGVEFAQLCLKLIKLAHEKT